MSEPYIEGEVYTITLWGNLGADRTDFCIYNHFSTVQICTLQSKGNGVYQRTFTAGANLNGINEFRILQFPSNGTSTSYIEKVQIEKGNKATDWTPAPEDQVSDWSVTDTTSYAYIKNKPTTLTGYGISASDSLLTSNFQAKDNDLTAITALTGTGFLKRTGTDTWSLDNSAYSLSSHLHDDRYLILSNNVNYSYNGNFALGTDGTRNFIQSHNGLQLDINPLGNLVTINGSSIWTSGNFNPSDYVTLNTAQGITANKSFYGFNNFYKQSAQSIPTQQPIAVNGMPDNSLAWAECAAIGFHNPNRNWSNLVYDGTFNFVSYDLSYYETLKAGNIYSNNNLVWHSGNFNPSNYLPLSGGTLTGDLHIYPNQGNYNHGIRLYDYQNWSGILFGANSGQTSGHDGTTNWWVASNPDNIFMINPIGSGTNQGLDLYRNGEMYWRGNKIWHSGNDGSGSGLDADLLDGLNSSSFFRTDGGEKTNINDASTLTNNSTCYWIPSTIGRPNTGYGVLMSVSDYIGWYNQLGFGTNNTIYFRQSINSPTNFGNWNTLAFTTDNVASATKLQTARTIWGQSFDGTNDITGRLITANGMNLFGGTKYQTTSNGVWHDGTTVFGNDGYDKVIIGMLTSSTNGAVIGGHNSDLTG
jgi:hypothetical protein